MDWVGDVSAGDWLHARIDDPWQGTMHDVVPRGYPAYARVFHPAMIRSMADGSAVPTGAAWTRLTPEERQSVLDRIVDAPISWAQTAAAFGTVFHPGAEWNALVRQPDDPHADQVMSPDGRQFGAPEEGSLDAASVSILTGVLARHTPEPGDVHAAVWEGFGGLVGRMGTTPTRMVYREDAGFRRGLRERLGQALQRPSRQEGLLSREISEGPRLRLPARDHILFHGRLAEFAEPDWPARVPWTETDWVQSFSLLWPDDLSWCAVTEVDHAFTVVGGSSALIGELCATEGLEALPIPAGANFTYGCDERNR